MFLFITPIDVIWGLHKRRKGFRQSKKFEDQCCDLDIFSLDRTKTIHYKLFDQTGSCDLN